MEKGVCKWCRERIAKVNLDHFTNRRTSTWLHAGGWRTCVPGVGSELQKEAEPADLRWEQVYLEISKPEITDYDLESGRSKFLKELLEIRMYVWYKGIRVYQVTRIHEATLHNMQFDIIKMVLDESVRKIDDYMEEMDRG